MEESTVVVCASLPDAGRELCEAGRARPPRRGPRSRRQPGLSPARKKDGTTREFYLLWYYKSRMPSDSFATESVC